MADKKVIAYKVYQCKLCPETREDPDAMSEHLMEKHGIRCIERYNDVFYDGT